MAALAIALVLVISGGYLAFTNRQDRDSGGSGGAVGGARNMATVKIGLIAPLTGALAELGLGMRNSVDLAIREANAKQTIQGYKLVLAAKDDAATPATGANVAKKLAADPLVAGVVGTLNSSVAQAVAPLLASANIVQISPVNTLDTLTRGVSHRAAPKRVWPTYFRVNSRDAFQGLFGADYAYTQAGFRTVVVIHDTEPYGRDLAKDFARRFQSKGGKVVGTLTVRQGATDFQTEANKVVDLNPDMVFYGGEYPEGGPLTRQLKARGFKGAVMGGDGLYAADFFKGADDKGEGTLVTVAGEPVERLDTASQFVNDYEAVGFKEGYGAYGAQSFDTANILIQVLAKALPNAENVDAARPQIVKAVGETNGFKGVTGEISFDEYGDIVNQAFTVYRAKGSDWLPVFSGKFEP